MRRVRRSARQDAIDICDGSKQIHGDAELTHKEVGSMNVNFVVDETIDSTMF